MTVDQIVIGTGSVGVMLVGYLCSRTLVEIREGQQSLANKMEHLLERLITLEVEHRTRTAACAVVLEEFKELRHAVKSPTVPN